MGPSTHPDRQVVLGFVFKEHPCWLIRQVWPSLSDGSYSRPPYYSTLPKDFIKQLIQQFTPIPTGFSKSDGGDRIGFALVD